MSLKFNSKLNLIKLKIELDRTKFLIKFGFSLIKIALGFKFLAQFGRRFLCKEIKFLIKFNLEFLFNFSFLIEICKKAFIFALQIFKSAFVLKYPLRYPRR